MAWFDAPILRHTPLAQQKREDREYREWVELHPMEEWPEWVFLRWQADKYARDGYPR